MKFPSPSIVGGVFVLMGVVLLWFTFTIGAGGNTGERLTGYVLIGTGLVIGTLLAIMKKQRGG
jgi:hypothetical protein